jgi:hypothetical protein
MTTPRSPDDRSREGTTTARYTEPFSTARHDPQEIGRYSHPDMQVPFNELPSDWISLPTAPSEAPITTGVEDREAECTEANSSPKVIPGEKGKDKRHDT